MTSITTNVKHRVRTTELEQKGYNGISDPDQNLRFTCIFSSYFLINSLRTLVMDMEFSESLSSLTSAAFVFGVFFFLLLFFCF